MNAITKEPTTILVVDDEDIVLSLVKDALEDQSADILTANGAKLAVDLLSKQSIDLLITDIRMPGMTGLELAKLASENHPDIKTIFMTGYANLSTAKDAIQHGAIDYILKPFELKEIRDSVQKVIEQIETSKSQNPERHLTQLTGLKDVLSQAEDHHSAALSSLHCGMMQTSSQRGCIAYRLKSDGPLHVLALSDAQGDSPRILPNIPADKVGRILDSMPTSPSRLTNPQDHPMFYAGDQYALDELFPDKSPDCNNLLLIPILSGDKAFGMMILASGVKCKAFSGTDTEFLSLVAGQFRTALQHINLLAKSRNAYKQLRKFQDQTVELEKLATRNAMSAEIGHDLNNFLSIVSGNIALIQINLKKNNPEKILKCVKKVESAVEKMTHFTANLMNPASTTSKREKLSLNTLLNEVVEFLSPQKRFEGIEVIPPVNLEPIEFTADSIQMQQVLYNLLNNAADAMKESPVKKIQMTVQLSKSEKQFTLTISDTGPGFSLEAKEKMFRQQFTTKKDGHGLGLNVCKRIIEQHQGSISVETSQESGASISITLPLIEKTENAHIATSALASTQ